MCGAMYNLYILQTKTNQNIEITFMGWQSPMLFASLEADRERSEREREKRRKVETVVTFSGLSGTQLKPLLREQRHAEKPKLKENKKPNPVHFGQRYALSPHVKPVYQTK